MPYRSSRVPTGAAEEEVVKEWLEHGNRRETPCLNVPSARGIVHRNTWNMSIIIGPPSGHMVEGQQIILIPNKHQLKIFDFACHFQFFSTHPSVVNGRCGILNATKTTSITKLYKFKFKAATTRVTPSCQVNSMIQRAVAC